MSEKSVPPRDREPEDASPFDELLGGPVSAASAAPAGGITTFTTAFRGYDKDEVDAAIEVLSSRLRRESEATAQRDERHRRARDTATARDRETIEQLEAELADLRTRESEASARLATADARALEATDRLEGELATVTAKASNAEAQVQALTDELLGEDHKTANRTQFEEVLRVAEDQASLIIRNATIQGDRLLEAAREEILTRRKEAVAEAEAIIARAQHDSQQAHLRIDTELTAHQSLLEREGQHAAEKVAQADQEAAAIRTEAEKGAAALRSMVARETTHARSEAEEAVRELRMRALEFEESLTRRQDDAQQEFLVLHNQAVAHAERITRDANEQVTASLDHAQRVATKADDFERLMRAQAHQIEADARLRAGEHLERARIKAERIIETVTTHSQSVLHDAEDRTRQLRWQQHQLTSFMAEVKELIRPEAPLESPAADEPVQESEASEASDAGEPEDLAEAEESAESEDLAEAEESVETEDLAETEEPEEPEESAELDRDDVPDDRADDHVNRSVDPEDLAASGTIVIELPAFAEVDEDEDADAINAR